MINSRRLQKELLELQKNPLSGIKILDASSLKEWLVEIVGPKETLFAGEKFQLKMQFEKDYPLSPPITYFVGKSPDHEHIYSNGHICLSILADEWSPALKVSSICLSIQSMLASCKKKQRPKDDQRYVMRVGNRSPKDTKWLFHDDKV